MDGCLGNMGEDSMIWVFWRRQDDVRVVVSSSQFITILCNAGSTSKFYITVVYTDCNPVVRRMLFDDLTVFAQSTSNVPWLMVGDFNCIANHCEKTGGILASVSSMHDFNDFIMAVGMVDAGYIGSPFTWSNNHTGSASMKARLDRAMFNSSWQDNMPDISVRHLLRGVSDHSPLLVIQINFPKHPSRFIFQDVWASDESFMSVISVAWKGVEQKSTSFTTLLCRLRAVKQALRVWNKEIFGNLQDNINAAEICVSQAEQGNPGPCGGGGCFRNSKGDVHLSFAYCFGQGNSVIAEVRALCDGLRLAVHRGIHITMVYSDSQMKCVDTQANCVDTTGYCFRIGFWEGHGIDTTDNFSSSLLLGYNACVVLVGLHSSLAVQCGCGEAVGPFILDCETER
ncbi:hypothetical protein Taro_052247 [Colocasia esculenta]|uniref:RNase H type-1 domain-containing protein n=1 Tax=Colocasia esculenta TaxID=4460 RepID=A0A843XIT0_COLES|nr:hypothetical protein [Colocasia esculenta]